MMQRLRESLALLLLAALPFHAFAVTALTHVWSGPNMPPLAAFAVWKEVVLGVIILIALAEVFRPKTPEAAARTWPWDALDVCIVLGMVLAALVSFGNFSGMDADVWGKQSLLGFKYDWVPLIAFFVLRRVPWSSTFLKSALRMLMIVGVIIAALGIMTLWIPLPFFVSLGYSDLHSLYRPGAPLAAFQFLEGTDIRRIQSVMSGPNQLGLWLLLPLSIVLHHMFLLVGSAKWRKVLMLLPVFATLVSALFLTYSRSAWIAFVFMCGIYAFIFLKPFLHTALRRSIAIVFCILVLVTVSIAGIRYAPHILVRSESLRGHIEKPLEALEIMMAHPYGLGLGTAGPASNRLNDTCLFFDAEVDTSWASGRDDLCIFVGDEQVLPTGRVCDCPLLTENWYLQWGIEMGIAGLLVSLLIPLFLLLSARRFDASDPRIAVVLSFLGISVAGLFLHAFEDSAVAYGIWLLLAAANNHKT